MSNQLINIQPKKCIACYACVRICPVNALQVVDYSKSPIINPNSCIGCGSCLGVCAPSALYYQDNKAKAINLLKSNNKVAAVVSSSISGEFEDITDYRKFVQMIRALGFDYVNEESFGSDLVALQYTELLTSFMGKRYFTANCPAIVSLIEKFHPELISNLAPIISPMIATTQLMRILYGESLKVIYIGPCIAAKKEAKRYFGKSKVDTVLTFIELRDLFKEYNIKESTVEYSEFDEPFGYKGSLYAISSGLVEAANINNNLMEGEIITTEGKRNVLDAVYEFEQSIDFIKKHFNIFYCEGCLMGPGTSQGGKRFLRRTLVIDYAKKRLRNFNIKKWEKQCEQYINSIDFNATFVNDNQCLPTPTEDAINDVLKILGKSNNCQKLGCGSCGYKSCGEFAINVAKGVANTELCATFSMQRKHEYIDALKQSNEDLEKTQKALLESEKKARYEHKLAQEALERTSTMLQKLPSAVVIVDKNMKIIESNQSFINILGDDAAEINEVIPGLQGADLKSLLPSNVIKNFTNVLTSSENIANKDIFIGDKMLNLSVFPIKKDEIIGAVLRDMYLPEVRKEEVINRVSEVIDENLELVQKIAFLLGEGAAKTEKMLNSIIESHTNNK